jgi:hypothetical protein
MAARRASLGHRDLATHPGTGMLDRPTWPWVLGLSGLEEGKDVLRARCRPQSEEMVILISERSAPADRYEPRVQDLRQDHGQHSFDCPRAVPGLAQAINACPETSRTQFDPALGALIG